jgi:uracil-DNA glycosylase
MRACEPWLIAELERVDPRVIVTLGAIAGQALIGSSFRVSAQRSQALPWTLPGTNGSQSSDRDRGFVVIATIHPSAVLRARDRDSAFQRLVRDLVVVRERVGDSY